MKILIYYLKSINKFLKLFNLKKMKQLNGLSYFNVDFPTITFSFFYIICLELY